MYTYIEKILLIINFNNLYSTNLNENIKIQDKEDKLLISYIKNTSTLNSKLLYYLKIEKNILIEGNFNINIDEKCKLNNNSIYYYSVQAEIIYLNIIKDTIFKIKNILIDVYLIRQIEHGINNYEFFLNYIL